MTTTGTERYYRERAREYDRVYLKPERQANLGQLETLLSVSLAGRQVLEVACGTGYWTERYVDHAAAVTATDINSEVLEVARGRRAWPATTTTFVEASAFELHQMPGQFDAAIAGFFWSHLLHDQLDSFLRQLVDRVNPGARIVLMDNRYVEGSSTPISRTDPAGNTYQTRTLDDGSAWEVLKNFPTPTDLHAQLSPHGAVDVVELDYFWIATLDLLAPEDL